MTGRGKTSATNTTKVTGKPKTTIAGTPSNSRSSSPPKAPSVSKGGGGSCNAAAAKQKTATTGSGSTSRGVTPPNVTSGSSSSTGGGSVPPPPPPPPAKVAAPKKPVPDPFLPPTKTPAGSYHVSLVAYGGGGGHKPHWGFFVHTPTEDNNGIMIHASGDVNKGFTFEIKRNHNFMVTNNRPNLRFLQVVDGKHFNDTMWNGGKHLVEFGTGIARCPFEISAAKAPAPGKSLNTVKDGASTSKSPPKVTHRNCQTWVIEAAQHLVADGIFLQDRVDYLIAIKS